MQSLFGYRNVLRSRFISSSVLVFLESFLLRSSYCYPIVMAIRQLGSKGTDQEAYREISNTTDKILFKFGIISDVQYGDVDDRLNFEGSTMRYYRNSLKLLEKAVGCWKKSKPDFVLQLGDLIEGNHVKRHDRETTLQSAIDVFKQLDCYICHIWGNHEFYLFSRKELEKSLLNSKVGFVTSSEHFDNAKHNNCQDNLCRNRENYVASSTVNKGSGILINSIPHFYDRTEDSGRKYYFAFSPHPKVKFIVLDSYDISICGWQEQDWEYEEARKILSVKNTNDNWNSPFGLEEPHFVKFNGGISTEQLHWLQEELAAATNANQHVIITSHVPLHPESTVFICNVWNYQDVLDIIWSHSCVKACLCGHSHEAGDFKDHKGIQHIVFPAVLECTADENAFADVFVYEDRMCIIGHGKVKSYLIDV